MVRLKIAYWEFDFEAVCPTLDHDLLSQAHISLLMISEDDQFHHLEERIGPRK